MRACYSGPKVLVFPYEPMSVFSRLLLEKIYELFVGTNKTVRNKRVGIKQVSTERGAAMYDWFHINKLT